MDTPMKKDSTPSTSSPNPISQFEDSPIFNYIYDLSPIKPLNSEQSFSLLNFGSPKTPINSPASTCPQKPKVASTSHLSYPLKPEPSDAENEGNKCQVTANGIQPFELHDGKSDCLGSCVGITTDAHTKLSESALDGCQYTNDDCRISLMEADGEQDYSDVMIKVASRPDELAELSNELHQCISSDHGGCDCKAQTFKCNPMSQTVGSKTSPSFLIQENSEETDNTYADSCNLSFMENILQLSEESIDHIQKMESIPLASYEEYDVKVPLAHPNAENRSEAGEASTSVPVADKALPCSSAEINYKPCPQQQQMLPRRCLVFEMSGTHYRKLMADTGGTSIISEQSACSAVSDEKQLVSSKCEAYNVSSLIPGIGLHLNTLATTRRDKIVVKQNLPTYRRKLISIPCTTSSHHCTSSDPEPLDSALDHNPMGEDLEPSNEKEQLKVNTRQSSAFTGSEELKQIYTKKKRFKSEIVGEGDSCKRCNCKRSKCLKLYCECFAAGLYCVDPCTCQGCLNKPAFEETVLETRRIIETRNPLAFAPKVIKIPDASEYRDELNTTPASARHKRGCNCKKSGCLKKYCECFQGGVGCSLSCRCEGCKNSFGQKDGADNILLEEVEAREDNPADVSFPEGVLQVDVEHQDPQATPCSENGRNPYGPVSLAPQWPSISSGFLQACTNQGLVKRTSSFPCRDSYMATTPCDWTMEEKTAKGVKDNNDTSTSVKSVSPKSKRVLPDHEQRHDPPRKFCRKLILRSIPSFPKLSQQGENDMSQHKSS